MYSLKLANCGLIASHCQLLEVNLTRNLALKELDLSRFVVDCSLYFFFFFFFLFFLFHFIFLLLLIYFFIK